MVLGRERDGRLLTSVLEDKSKSPMFKIGIVYMFLGPHNVFIEALVDQLHHQIKLIIFN